jgi:hemoglobin
MDEKKTLYDRIGGAEGVRKLVRDFYDRVLEDKELQPFFLETPMSKLRTMQFELFSAALGGPIEYTGEPLYLVHFGRGIGKHHLAIFSRHLFATLAEMNLGEQDVQDVISRINTYADQITGSRTLVLKTRPSTGQD